MFLTMQDFMMAKSHLSQFLNPEIIFTILIIRQSYGTMDDVGKVIDQLNVSK